MGFLDDETRQRLTAMMGEDQPVEAPDPPPAAAAVSEPEVDIPSQEAQDVNESAKEEASEIEVAAEPEGEVEIEVEDGHRVPYNRFKQVLDARNGHREEVESLRQEVETLKSNQQSWQQPQQAQPPPQPQVQPREDDWWSEFQAESGAAPEAPHGPDPQLAQLQHRVEAQEVAFQKMVLERELNAASEKFPSIDRRQILQAVHQNPSMPVMQIAEQYSTWLAGIEEAAIARHLSDSPSAAAEEAKVAAPQAPPRPAQSGVSDASRFVGEKKPASIEEGSKMLREFLKTHNPFAT